MTAQQYSDLQRKFEQLRLKFGDTRLMEIFTSLFNEKENEHRDDQAATDKARRQKRTQ